MVASHKRLLKRLLGYTRFQEITKAVRFVAGGELGKLRKKLKRRFTALSSFIPLFGKKYVVSEATKCLVVSIADDRGSCGAHNNTVLNATVRLLDSMEESNKEFKIYAIGKKIMNFLKFGYKKQLVGYSQRLTDVKFNIDICSYFIIKFMRYNMERIYLVFNRYYNLQVQRPVVYRLCNFNIFMRNILKNTFSRYGVYFNSIINRFNISNFANDLYLYGASLFLVDSLNENKYSFYAGRYVAMDNAVNNSQEMIDKLRIAYNKARQEYITTELVEIVGCSEAMTISE